VEIFNSVARRSNKDWASGGAALLILTIGASIGGAYLYESNELSVTEEHLKLTKLDEPIPPSQASIETGSNSTNPKPHKPRPHPPQTPVTNQNSDTVNNEVGKNSSVASSSDDADRRNYGFFVPNREEPYEYECKHDSLLEIRKSGLIIYQSRFRRNLPTEAKEVWVGWNNNRVSMRQVDETAYFGDLPPEMRKAYPFQIEVEQDVDEQVDSCYLKSE
jgi:hypothetical protein